jgi:hypothetical protein
MVDRNDYPPGPNGLALLCADRIAELEQERAIAATRDEKRAINKHLHLCRDMLRWCKTRAGYVSTDAS